VGHAPGDFAGGEIVIENGDGLGGGDLCPVFPFIELWIKELLPMRIGSWPALFSAAVAWSMTGSVVVVAVRGKVSSSAA
jgi:hypothetical protein